MRERKKQHFSMFGLELVIWYHLGARGQSEGGGGGHDIYNCYHEQYMVLYIAHIHYIVWSSQTHQGSIIIPNL